MPPQNKKPIIVGFVADLLFNVQIENVARKLGYEMRWIKQPTDVAPDEPHKTDESPGELLQGQGGALFTKLSQWQPALLLFDLNNSAIPWREWIASLKSSPATRRIPVLCFGSHIETETLKEAKAMGADTVVARSRFSSALPELLQQHVRVKDTDALHMACAEPLADLALRGIDEFNKGQFYQCHDFLEKAWMADDSPGRDLYRGILQVGIAYYQIERGNYRGAVKMLLRVRQWLAPLPDVCRQVNVARLREDIERVHEACRAAGQDGMEQVDRGLFRRIEVFSTQP